MRLRVLVLATLMFSACTHLPSPAERTRSADLRARAADWQALDLDAGTFVLRAYTPVNRSNDTTLTVYIEGDGQAWLSSSRPSPDPTPVQPIAFELALKHPRDSAAAYLARPCQYVQGDKRRNCTAAVWTRARFSPAVIAATDIAVSDLKQRRGAERLVLVGYSGGGAIATLLAARRNDVTRLVTVAGNLDTTAWTQLHKLSPLSDSLNPVDNWQRLQTLPQLHLVGREDRIVPPTIVRSYQAHFPARRQPTACIIAGFDHHCCWVERWPALLTTNSCLEKTTASER